MEPDFESLGEPQGSQLRIGESGELGIDGFCEFDHFTGDHFVFDHGQFRDVQLAKTPLRHRHLFSRPALGIRNDRGGFRRFEIRGATQIDKWLVSFDRARFRLLETRGIEAQHAEYHAGNDAQYLDGAGQKLEPGFWFRHDTLEDDLVVLELKH